MCILCGELITQIHWTESVETIQEIQPLLLEKSRCSETKSLASSGAVESDIETLWIEAERMARK